MPRSVLPSSTIAEFALGAGLLTSLLGLAGAAATAGAAQPNVIGPIVAFAFGAALIAIGLQRAKRDRCRGMLLATSTPRRRTVSHGPVFSTGTTERVPGGLRTTRRVALAWVDQPALPRG